MRILISTLLLLAATYSAQAEEEAYRPQDAIEMQSCIETVRDINASDEPDNLETQQHSASYTDCIGRAANACQNAATQNQSTIGIVRCTYRETLWWDELLNDRYQTLKSTLDTEEFGNLRAAQRAWLAYREAECDFQYFYWREGTIRSIFGASCNLEMTARRAIALGGIIDWAQL